MSSTYHDDCHRGRVQLLFAINTAVLGVLSIRLQTSEVLATLLSRVDSCGKDRESVSDKENSATQIWEAISHLGASPNG